MNEACGACAHTSDYCTVYSTAVCLLPVVDLVTAHNPTDRGLRRAVRGFSLPPSCVARPGACGLFVAVCIQWQRRWWPRQWQWQWRVCVQYTTEMGDVWDTARSCSGNCDGSLALLHR